jgi:hypothetical protein
MNAGCVCLQGQHQANTEIGGQIRIGMADSACLGDPNRIRRRPRIGMGKQGVNLTMTTPASSIAWQSADFVHSTMYAELVLADLLFVAASAVGYRAHIGMVFRVGTDMAVQARQKAVYRPGE